MKRAQATLVALLLVGSVLGTPSSLLAFPWPSRARAVERVLSSGSVEEKRAAVAALGTLSKAMARRALELALADPDREVRLLAAAAAEDLSFDEGGALVVPWLQEPDSRLRRAALGLLRLGPPQGAVPALGRVLSSAEIDLRVEAAEVLGRIRPDEATDASQRLLGALEDPEPRVRGASLESLGRLGLAEVALAVGLRLDDSEADVRTRAAVALGAIGEAVSEPALLLALHDREASVRTAAIESLGLLGLPSSVPGLLAEARRLPWTRTQAAAVASLGRIESAAGAAGLVGLLDRREAEEQLLEALRAQGVAVREPLLGCLEQSAGRVLELCGGLWLEQKQPSALIRELVARGRLGDNRALEMLERALPDEETMVFALERLSHEDRAVRGLARRLLRRVTHWEPALREPVREAVSRRGLAASERAELLALLVGDEDPSTHKLAEAYLTSTAPASRRSAALVLVHAGAPVPQVLSWLADAELSGGVAQELARGLTDDLALALLQRYRSEASSVRRSMRVALRGLDDKASRSVVEALVAEQRSANATEAEELLGLLVRLDAADPELLERARQGSVAERRQLAQWAAFRRNGDLARALLGDSDPEVRALAAQSAGRAGAARAAEALAAPTRTRAERLGALSAVLQGLDPEQSHDLARYEARLSDPDPAVRLLSLEILGRARSSHGALVAQTRLRIDPHPLVRRAAARLLRSDDTAASRRALRVCSSYEPDRSVALACNEREVPAETSPTVPSLISVRAADGVSLARSSAVALMSQGALYFAVTSPSGRLILPEPSAEIADPGLAF